MSGGRVSAEVQEAAVIQTLAENENIRDFFRDHRGATVADFLKTYPSAQDPETQILRDYVGSHPDIGSYQILDVTGSVGIGNKVFLGAPQADGTTSYYVGFQGTQSKEWYDNGEGMAQVSTMQQRDAAQYFDRMVQQYNVSDSDKLVVTGHSKGGNKAQYVTLASENADLVDSCIALDGQGFSPEAVAAWEAYPDVYEARRSKITLVAGSNDYVHVMGVRVAKETIYLQNNVQVGLSDAATTWHYNEFLFKNYWDPVNERYVFSAELESIGVQSGFSKEIEFINDFLMSLPPEERMSASLTIMGVLADGTMDGSSMDLKSLVSTLRSLLLLTGHYGNGTSGDIDPRLQSVYHGMSNLLRTLEERMIREAQEQAGRIHAQAQLAAAASPRIYIDTASWDQMGSTMWKLASVDLSGVRMKLASIKSELDDLLFALESIGREASDVVSSAKNTLDNAMKAVYAFSSGNPLEGAYATLEAAKSAADTAKQAVELAAAVVNAAATLGNSVKQAIFTLAQAFTMADVGDDLRGLAEYLSSTAQEFDMAERQNMEFIRQWEV